MLVEDSLNHLDKELTLKIINRSVKMIITKKDDLFEVKIYFAKLFIIELTELKFLEVFEKLSITL